MAISTRALLILGELNERLNPKQSEMISFKQIEFVISNEKKGEGFYIASSLGHPERKFAVTVINGRVERLVELTRKEHLKICQGTACIEVLSVSGIDMLSNS